MTNGIYAERDEAPTIEVRVYRDGELVHEELCESDEQAALIIEDWSELDGVTCEVDDLSVPHLAGDLFESEPSEQREEDYPEQVERAELETRARRDE